MFDYDVQTKRKIDQEIGELLSEYYNVHKANPDKITVSKQKMTEIKMGFPVVHQHVFMFDDIPIEVDNEQKEDYRLSRQ